MPFLLETLINPSNPPICIHANETIQSALDLMIDKGFSQLPIIDEQGNYIGLLTEKSIIYHYRLIGYAETLKLAVSHLISNAVTLSPKVDVFEALKSMERESAIVVIEKHKPLGVLSDYDFTRFFREISEGITLVQDIETNLRQRIDNLFPTDEEKTAALIAVFGAEKSDPEQPNKNFEEMSLWDTIQFIAHQHNWTRFEEYFQPRDLFLIQLHSARIIRNKLAHFRGKLDRIEYNTLVIVRNWLNTRPQETETIATVTRFTADTDFGDTTQPLETLAERLRNVKTNRITLSFEIFEGLMGFKLSEFAKEHRSWWDNEVIGNPQARAWLEHGWKVYNVDFASQEVTFSKTILAPIQLHLVSLLASLREKKPGLTNAAKVGLQNWADFSAGRYGFTFAWVFGHAAFRVELYLSSSEKERNKKAFDMLFEQRHEIEEQIGHPLVWERLEGKIACRIKSERPFQLATANKNEVEELNQWGVDEMLRFIEVFQERVRSLSL